MERRVGGDVAARHHSVPDPVLGRVRTPMLTVSAMSGLATLGLEAPTRAGVGVSQVRAGYDGGIAAITKADILRVPESMSRHMIGKHNELSESIPDTEAA